jgi:hypothetical protein
MIFIINNRNKKEALFIVIEIQIINIIKILSFSTIYNTILFEHIFM